MIVVLERSYLNERFKGGKDENEYTREDCSSIS